MVNTSITSRNFFFLFVKHSHLLPLDFFRLFYQGEAFQASNSFEPSMRRIKCLLQLEMMWSLIFTMTMKKTFLEVNNTVGLENTASDVKESMRSKRQV